LPRILRQNCSGPSAPGNRQAIPITAMSLARYPCSGSANLHPVDSFARPERLQLRISLLACSSNAEGDDASAVAFEFRIAL